MSSIFPNLSSASKVLFHAIPLYFFLLMFCLALGFEFSIFSESVYDQKRYIQLGAFLLLTSFLLIDRTQNFSIHYAWLCLPKITRLALLQIAVLGAISSYLAPLPKYAFQEWSLFGLLFMFTLFVSTQLVAISAQKVVLAALAIGISLYCWRYLAGVYVPSLGNADAVRGYELFVGFAHPRFLNQIQSWILPLLPALPIVFRNVPKRYCWFLWIPGIFGWTLLFASSGRATLIAMVFSAVVVLILYYRKSLPWLKNHLLFAISGLIIYLGLFHWIPQAISVDMNLPKVTERLAQDGLMGRDRLWGLAMDIAKANPVLGLGPQQYANYHHHTIAAHPHSAPLQWVSEWGVISFFLICGLLGYGFVLWVKFCKRNLREVQSEQSILLLGLTASLVAGAIHALVSGIIVMPYSQMLMCLVIGWALAVYWAEKKPQGSNALASKLQQISLTSMVVIFLTTIAFTSYPDILQTDQMREEFLTRHPQENILQPRFWNQGLIGWKLEKETTY